MVATRSQKLKERRESFSLKDLFYLTKNKGKLLDENENIEIVKQKKKVKRKMGRKRVWKNKENKIEKENLIPNININDGDQFFECNTTNRKTRRAMFLKNQLSNTHLHLDLHSEKSIRVKSRIRNSFTQSIPIQNENSVLSYKLELESKNLLCKSLQKELDISVKTISNLKQLVFQYQKERIEHRDTIQKLKGTIRVVARLKPCTLEDTSMFIDDSKTELNLIEKKRGRKRNYNYSFDRIFNQETSQLELYEDVSSFINSAIDGNNVCLLSYGQTGSGKTFTMTGELQTNSELRGITPRAIESVLEQLRKLKEQEWEVSLMLNVIEIYNDSAKNLISELTDESQMKSTEVRSLEEADKLEITEKTTEEILEILRVLNQKRITAETNMNSTSSRSHLITTLFITTKKKDLTLEGSLSLCDLAGSERLKRSGSDRVAETCSINKSLSALKDVFQGLRLKNSFVPFRNSKLTHFLKSSFTGGGRVMMILNLSSSEEDIPESLCSLRFAADASKTQVTYA